MHGVLVGIGVPVGYTGWGCILCGGWAMTHLSVCWVAVFGVLSESGRVLSPSALMVGRGDFVL